MVAYVEAKPMYPRSFTHRPRFMPMHRPLALASEPTLPMDEWPCGCDDASRADVRLTKPLAVGPSGVSATVADPERAEESVR